MYLTETIIDYDRMFIFFWHKLNNYYGNRKTIYVLGIILSPVEQFLLSQKVVCVDQKSNSMSGRLNSKYYLVPMNIFLYSSTKRS
jgi:hypothetical protein